MKKIFDIAKIIRKMRSGIDETLYNKVNTLFESRRYTGAKNLSTKEILELLAILHINI